MHSFVPKVMSVLIAIHLMNIPLQLTLGFLPLLSCIVNRDFSQYFAVFSRSCLSSFGQRANLSCEISDVESTALASYLIG